MFLSEPEWQAVLLSLKVSSPGGGLELALWHLFFPAAGSAHLSRQGAARQYSPFTAGAASGGGGVPAAGGHGAARVYWQLAV